MLNGALTDAGVVVDERVEALALLVLRARAKAAEHGRHSQIAPRHVARLPVQSNAVLNSVVINHVECLNTPTLSTGY